MEPSLDQIFGGYTAWEAQEGTWFINFMNGTENLYLLEGEQQALLLDTGYGAGDLRSFVEKLTDKPLIVANTHYHPDHAGGNGLFREVYMSPGAAIDAPAVERPGAGPVDRGTLPFPDYRKKWLRDGDLIDLGGRVVEVLEAKPAHCNSSLFFLDRTRRLLFCGDELEAAQVMMFDNSRNPDAPYDVRTRIENMRENCLRLKARSDEFDWLLPNHNGFPIAKSYIDDYIALADAIFDGTAAIEDRLNHPFVELDPVAPELCRVRQGKASIFIKKAELMKIYPHM